MAHLCMTVHLSGMNVVPCRECGSPVSTSWRTCKKCGCDDPCGHVEAAPARRLPLWVVVALVVLVAAVLLAYMPR